MAPLKFEENIREKLQERELQPSKESWGKLSTQLDARLPEKKRSTFIWVAVAASFVGILLLTALWMQKSSTSTQLVEEAPPSKALDGTEMPTVIPDEVLANIEQVDASGQDSNRNGQDLANSGNNAKSVVVNSKQPIVKTNDQLLPNAKKDGIIALNTGQPENKSSVEAPSETNFIDQKVKEVVASVQKIQGENQTVTLDEIDALLAKAQRDIATNRILNSNTQKIDAAALLMDVESELQRSFRDRVFEALGEGYLKVRTAMAERNN